MKKCIQFTSVILFRHIRKISFAFVIATLFTSCNENSVLEPIDQVNNKISLPSEKTNLRTSIDLQEVTITGYRDYSNMIASIYTLYIGADYRLTSDPYRALQEEYAGQNINDIPHIMDLILTRLNQYFISDRETAFNDQEMAFLRTLTVKQVFTIYAIIKSTTSFGERLRFAPFTGEAVDGGFSNAFMHIYMPNRIAALLGANLATQFMNAHEANERGLNTEMDVKNNALGISLMSTKIDYEYMLAMAKNGQVWTIVNNNVGRYPYIATQPRPNYQN